MQVRLMETREHDEHIGNSNQRNQRNQILSKNNMFFCRLHLSFYRNEGEGSYRRRRFMVDSSAERYLCMFQKFVCYVTHEGR